MQIPSNHNHISHQIYRETANEEMFKFNLNGSQRYAPVLSIDDYARIFFNCGAEQIVVFEKIYPHVLEDSDAVVEWISGTALVPYFERLGEHKDKFVQSIREKMQSRPQKQHEDNPTYPDALNIKGTLPEIAPRFLTFTIRQEDPCHSRTKDTYENGY